MEEGNSVESMITSAVFLLKKYVRTKRNLISEAIKEESNAVIEPSQSLITSLHEIQNLVDELESQIRVLDVSFKQHDKKIRDKLAVALGQQKMLRLRRNKLLVNQNTNHLIHVTQNCLLMPDLQSVSPIRPEAKLPEMQIESLRQLSVRADTLSGSTVPTPEFRCAFCSIRPYSGKPPLLKHISDTHPERFQVYQYIMSLTPESVFNSSM